MTEIDAGRNPLFERIREEVRRIPGRVATYGQIARRLGMPRWRGPSVGRWTPRTGPMTCHGIEWSTRREKQPAGRRGAELQRSLLEDEGVVFGIGGRIDLARFGWEE